jgi:predicted RNA-binding Zn-ribbon protein involved in translation (DUF1610 family)
MASDYEESDRDCPKCGAQLATRRCDEIGCDGGRIDEGFTWGVEERCDRCNGRGHLEWCRECGWDMNYSQFLSPQYEAEWLAKQEAGNG